jgi:hypothetical protein
MYHLNLPFSLVHEMQHKALQCSFSLKGSFHLKYGCCLSYAAGSLSFLKQFTIISSAARISGWQRCKKFCLQTDKKSGIRRSRLF